MLAMSFFSSDLDLRESNERLLQLASIVEPSDERAQEYRAVATRSHPTAIYYVNPDPMLILRSFRIGSAVFLRWCLRLLGRRLRCHRVVPGIYR